MFHMQFTNAKDDFRMVLRTSKFGTLRQDTLIGAEEAAAGGARAGFFCHQLMFRAGQQEGPEIFSKMEATTLRSIEMVWSLVEDPHFGGLKSRKHSEPKESDVFLLTQTSQTQAQHECVCVCVCVCGWLVLWEISPH